MFAKELILCRMIDMRSFLSAVNIELPLRISFSSWDETTLVISGESWSFSTQSVWRIFDGKGIFLGCLDDQSLEVSSILNGSTVVGVDFQSPDRPIDLVFRLEGGKDLEIFSTDLDEPWVLTLPQFGVFVGSGERIL
mgnify:CR=1 FL=1